MWTPFWKEAYLRRGLTLFGIGRTTWLTSLSTTCKIAYRLIVFNSMQRPNSVSSDRFVQVRRTKASEEEEHRGRLRRLYVTAMVGSLFIYLNFAKNPFN